MPRKSHLDIPPPYGNFFARYDSFNELQAALFDDLLQTDKSVVLSAPTGSGKTVAFELAVVRMLQLWDAAAHQGIPPKAIYIAPIKALCTEKFADWKPRFAALNVNCVQITGDTESSDLMAVHGAEVVVTTPEKWDSMTRRWREFSDVMNAVQLLMIDEVHLLNEDVRGPILEVVVSRMKTVVTRAVRFVVASATIPNIEDLRLWICSGRASADVLQFNFNEMQRPVPLEKHILGFNSKSKGFQFDMSLNYKLPQIISKYSEGKATLIFCNSRKSTEMAANLLAKNGGMFQLSSSQQTALNEMATRLEDSKLRNLVVHGIAFHHAGITLNDRGKIEDGFRNNIIMVLLSTNTLAMGLNLPAHLVVIKSTESYCHGMYVEYTESNLLQMIGRAGRPQFDTKGVAVIMTHKRNVAKYEDLMYGQIPVESHLHKHLAEHLNAEIGLKTITNLEVAMNWIRTTFLYVRAVRVPEKYGLEGSRDKDIIERKLERLCLEQLNALEAEEMVIRSVLNDLDVEITDLGKLMARYYISFETMKLFRQMRGTETILEVLNIIVRCNEFSDHMLRVNEKKVLNDLNSSPLRFPIRGRIKTREEKISCLLQSILGNRSIAHPGLLQEATKIMRIGERVSKCLLEYMRLCGKKLNAFDLGCYKALLHSVTIAKCFHAKLWENSEFACKQLRKIGAVYSSSLASAGKITLKSIAKTDARTIEQILNKSYPFGDEVLQNLGTFPEYMLHVNLKATDMLHVFVKQINEGYKFEGSSSVLIVGDSANNLLLFDGNLESHLLEFGYFEKTIKIPNAAVERLMVHVIHNSLVGVDEHAELIINPPPKLLQNEAKKQSTKTANKRKEPSIASLSMQLRKKSKINPGTKPDDTPTILHSKLLDKLDTFAFKKAQVGLSTNTTRSEETLDESASTSLNAFETKKNKSEEAAFSDSCVNRALLPTMDTSSELIQTKVTEYFANKKYYSANETLNETSKFFSTSSKNGSMELGFKNSENVSNEYKECPKQPQQSSDESLIDSVSKSLSLCHGNRMERRASTISINAHESQKTLASHRNSVDNSLLMQKTAAESDSEVELHTVAMEIDKEVGVANLNTSLKKNMKPTCLHTFLRPPTKSAVEKENVSWSNSSSESYSKKTQANQSQGPQMESQLIRSARTKSVESSKSSNNHSFKEPLSDHTKTSSLESFVGSPMAVGTKNGAELLKSQSTNSSVEILSEKSNKSLPRTATARNHPVEIISEVSFLMNSSIKEAGHVVKQPNLTSDILNENLSKEMIAQSLISKSRSSGIINHQSNLLNSSIDNLESGPLKQTNAGEIEHQHNLSNFSIDNFVNEPFSTQHKTRSFVKDSSSLRVDLTINTSISQRKFQSQQAMTENLTTYPFQGPTNAVGTANQVESSKFDGFLNEFIRASGSAQFARAPNATITENRLQHSSAKCVRQHPEKQFSQRMQTQKSLIMNLHGNAKESDDEHESPLCLVTTTKKTPENELEFVIPFSHSSGNERQNRDESLICLDESSSVQSPTTSMNNLKNQASNEKSNKIFSQSLFQSQKSFISFPINGPENELNEAASPIKFSSNEYEDESPFFSFKKSTGKNTIQTQIGVFPSILDISTADLTDTETMRVSNHLAFPNQTADNRNNTIFEISSSDPGGQDEDCNKKIGGDKSPEETCHVLDLSKNSKKIYDVLDLTDLSADLHEVSQPLELDFSDGGAEQGIRSSSVDFDLELFKPSAVAVREQHNNNVLDISSASFCTSRKIKPLDMNWTRPPSFEQCDMHFDIISVSDMTTESPLRTVHSKDRGVQSFAEGKNAQIVAATKKKAVISDNHTRQSSSASSTTTERTLMFWFNIAHTFANLNPNERTFSHFKKIYSNMASLNLTALQLTKAELSANSVPGHVGLPSNRYRLKLFATADRPGEAKSELTPEPNRNSMQRADIDNINRSVMKYVLNNKCDRNDEPPTISELDFSSMSSMNSELERMRKWLNE